MDNYLNVNTVSDFLLNKTGRLSIIVSSANRTTNQAHITLLQNIFIIYLLIFSFKISLIIVIWEYISKGDCGTMSELILFKSNYRCRLKQYC